MQANQPSHAGPTLRSAGKTSRGLLPARRRCFLGVSGLLLAALASAQELDLGALARQSQLIFQGTVQKLGAATEARFPVDERTAVVRVDQVLRAPAQFQALKGQAVTVELRRDLPAKIGDAAVFFTRSWLFGKTLAVVEVGRMAGADAASLPARIREVDARAADEKLGQRVARAQLIVLGTVTETRPAPGGAKRPITEHDPIWWEATIAVQSVEKGERPPVLRVLFPASTDEMWIDSPKLRRGMAALLLLQRDQQEKGLPVLRRRGWTALDPLDVLPPDQVERVRSLVKAPRY